MTDLWRSFFVLEGSLFVKVDIDGHQDVHCFSHNVLILRITEAALVCCYLYSQRGLFSSMLRWVSFVSCSNLYHLLCYFLAWMKSCLMKAS